MNKPEYNNVVAEFTIPAESFVLADTLRRFPEAIVEFEQLIPTGGRPLPYFWTTDVEPDEFEDAAANDPTVESVDCVGEFADGALFHATWANTDDGILDRLQRGTETVLKAEARDGEWTLKVRADSQDSIQQFHAYFTENDIDFQVIRVFPLTEPKMGQFNVTEKQRDALLVALEMGYFEIPRDATLADVADELNITPNSASQRLRRGQINLLHNTLKVGQLTGVGLE